jgi:hypothetical protein
VDLGPAKAVPYNPASVYRSKQGQIKAAAPRCATDANGDDVAAI